MKVEVAIFRDSGSKASSQGFIYEVDTSAWADFKALTEVFDRFITYRKLLDDSQDSKEVNKRLKEC